MVKMAPMLPPMPDQDSGVESTKHHPVLPQRIRTPLTDFFSVPHPIMLAGMNQAASSTLAAAVCNAGGIGVIGGVGYTPKFLRESICDLKKMLRNPHAPFGVDLLLPQIGGNARKTNKDYTRGKLPELIDIIVEEGVKLFVCAVGIPPRWAVDKLHKAGIPVMNIVGHPKHVTKALEGAGVDMICCQGGEAGGHTGDIPSSILIPRVVDICKGHVSPLTGQPIMVLAGGGIFDGRGVAAALGYGAVGVWVGTRFVCTKEAGAPKLHKEAILKAGPDDLIRTVIFTGRPLRLVKTPYVEAWEAKPEKIKELTSRGIIPVMHDLEKDDPDGSIMKGALSHWFAGYVACMVEDIPYAREIVNSMVKEAAAVMEGNGSYLVQSSGRL
ncbi:2-nitropropane dioxygenase [Tilletiaria anomala UBC 951]|uniref:2-nitropropane dioxygenase n=1 Tax=Tilletiaria anomala (strain ATCC 24038 / CBS 436.72 / UBC 951) TaxID=1037660 RepID=A0A066WFB2_TILAU|nr:2-nitropropane dioxygenase [Tilletiaria anomala UBC 951]KDN52461.1 2-nitropropane dioxygenase [Tilletiaria anomala UBC 951]